MPPRRSGNYFASSQFQRRRRNASERRAREGMEPYPSASREAAQNQVNHFNDSMADLAEAVVGSMSQAVQNGAQQLANMASTGNPIVDLALVPIIDYALDSVRNAAADFWFPPPLQAAGPVPSSTVTFLDISGASVLPIGRLAIEDGSMGDDEGDLIFDDHVTAGFTPRNSNRIGELSTVPTLNDPALNRAGLILEPQPFLPRADGSSKSLLPISGNIDAPLGVFCQLYGF